MVSRLVDTIAAEGSVESTRDLVADDSQVTISCELKGRARSVALLSIGKRSNAIQLLAGIHLGWMWVPSEWNRADGPTRGGEIAPPSGEVGEWYQRLEGGDESGLQAMYERWYHCTEAAEGPGSVGVGGLL